MQPNVVASALDCLAHPFFSLSFSKSISSRLHFASSFHTPVLKSAGRSCAFYRSCARRTDLTNTRQTRVKLLLPLLPLLTRFIPA